jgi:phospholipid transport system substrate-binding protein
LKIWSLLAVVALLAAVAPPTTADALDSPVPEAATAPAGTATEPAAEPAADDAGTVGAAEPPAEAAAAGTAGALQEAATAAEPAEAAAAEPAANAEASPVGTVHELHTTLLDCMKNAESLGYQGRFERLLPVVHDVYDMQFMASKAAGRHWRDFTPEQQATWVELFRRYTVANYAGRFVGYNGQRFDDKGTEPSTHDTVIVRTMLVNPTDEDVQLDYRLIRNDGTWRIIDVYMQGTVSELALRRAEYGAALERDGFDSVRDSLESKIADLAAG